MKSCSFTGHRNIEASVTPRVSELVARAIEYLYVEGCRDFYVGGALGFDTLCAKAVILFRISHPDVRLHMVLPCRDQDEGWSRAQKEVYSYTLSVANDIEYVSEDYYDGCMKKRNERLAELCDVVVAYVGRSNSGAGQTVRLASAAGKTVYNLYKKANGEM